MDRSRSLLFAGLLILVGIVLLLQEADVIRDDISVWPIVVMAVGVLLFLDRRRHGAAGGSGSVLPLVLVAAGLAFLLDDLGVLGADDDLVLPLVVIAIGVGLVAAALPSRAERGGSAERVEIPLDGATRAHVEVRHGGGRLRVGSGAEETKLLAGSLVGGGEARPGREGGRLDVTVRPTARRLLPLPPVRRLDWTIELSRRVPIDLDLRTGASEMDLDLEELRIERLSIDTGASSARVVVPATGRPVIRIRGGAASLRLAIPSRMVASIHVSGGLHDLRIDERRFPRTPFGDYRSTGFDDAPDRAEITVAVGAASLEVV